MTKDEIFRDLKDDYESKTPTWLRTYDKLFTEVILPAMDIYAKQEAIGFAEWIAENGYILRPYHGWINMKSEIYYTDNQLYNIYKQPN